jgi:integrase
MSANRLKEEDMTKQGARIRATDSRGRVIKGLYIRDGRFIAGFQNGDRWQMVTLKAETLTEARRERESLLSAFREGRIAQRDGSTFEALFSEWQEARSISPRTKAHERHLLDRHLGTLNGRRVQGVDARDLAKILRGMRDSYSPWTTTAVYRILVGTFAFAAKRGVIVRSPVEGLTDAEKPRQKNKTKIAVLDGASMEKLIAAASTERWKASIGLAGFAGLRLGEVRGVRWSDVDLDGNTISVARSLPRRYSGAAED